MKAGALGLAVCLLGTSLSAQERAAEGTVLIRVVADATATITDVAGSVREVDLPGLRIVTGTGMIVSRFGYVVTNHHVVAPGEFRGQVQGFPATIRLTVQRIEVRLSPEQGAGRPAVHIEASIVAGDPDLDLAILAIPGNDFPYVPFGDSDAIQSGQPVTVVGYPLGEALDIFRESADSAFAPAVVAGTVSALRRDAQGDVRYIQTSAPLNRGNSGGPLLDRFGFAAGVVQMKATGTEGIGFAIPINLVKDFLARNGVDSSLPSTRLTRGPVFDSSEKLVRMQVPTGFEDTAPSRLGVDSGSSLPGVSLRVDRIAAAWSAERIEEELRSGRTFERYASTRSESSTRDDRALRGQAAGRADGRPFRMLYAVIDLGVEKVVARYIGGAEQIAFNESVLTTSLASLDAAPMLAGRARDNADVQWARVSPAGGPGFVTVIPAGWILDSGMPGSCRGLAVPPASVVASPRHDFTVSFRAGQHETALDPQQAAARCAARNGASTGDEYQYVFTRFGVEYTVTGQFHRSGSRTLQLEAVSPTRSFDGARDLFSRWLSELGVTR